MQQVRALPVASSSPSPPSFWSPLHESQCPIFVGPVASCRPAAIFLFPLPGLPSLLFGAQPLSPGSAPRFPCLEGTFFPQHPVGIILKDPKAVVFAGSSSPSSVLQMRRLRLSKVKSLALDNLLSWDSKQGDLAAPAPPLLMHIPMSIVFLSSQTDEGHVLKEI